MALYTPPVSSRSGWTTNHSDRIWANLSILFLTSAEHLCDGWNKFSLPGYAYSLLFFFPLAPCQIEGENIDTGLIYTPSFLPEVGPMPAAERQLAKDCKGKDKTREGNTSAISFQLIQCR